MWDVADGIRSTSLISISRVSVSSAYMFFVSPSDCFSGSGDMYIFYTFVVVIALVACCAKKPPSLFRGRMAFSPPL